MKRVCSVIRRSAVAVTLLCWTLLSLPVQAEMYVAGQLGVSFPQKLLGVQWDAGGSTLSGNHLSLDNSVMYGAKVGYYFDSLKWLGIETEVFNSTPHVKQQDVTIGGIGLGTQPGMNLRVLTWAPVNIVVRHQMGAFEPYAGVGVGVFFSHLSNSSNGSSTDVGLNTQLGLRYLMTTHLAFFGEYKFNHADNLRYDNVGGTGLGLTADYNAHNLLFGIGYHF